MPWDVFKKNDQYCVYKVDSSGQETGDSLGCHTSRGDANDQLAALYANVGESALYGFMLDADQRTALQAMVGEGVTLPDSLHMTMLYLNQSAVVSPFVNTLRMIGQSIADSFDPLVGTVNGVARFSGELQDSLVVTFDSPAISKMHDMAMMYSSWSGIPVTESHSFVPHITIGTLAKEGATPDISLTPAEMKFKTMALAFGPEMFEYSFIKMRLAKEGQAPEGEGEDDDTEHSDPAPEADPVPSPNPVPEPPPEPPPPATESAKGTPPVTKFTIQETVKDNRVQVTIVTESVMSGAYPNIPLPMDIIQNMAADEVFVTLPVGQANAESLNGRKYSSKSMQALSDQINQLRPESNWGHIPEYDMGYTYNSPPVRWLVSQMDSNGVVWAKGRALTPEAQLYYKNAKKDNARVGTSIMAWAEMDGKDVINLDILTIDLADPARVGVPMTAAKPFVTSEMDDKTKQGGAASDPAPQPDEDKPKMPEITQEQLDIYTKQTAELTALTSLRKTVAEALGVPETADFAAEIRKSTDSMKVLSSENTALLQDTIAAESLKRVKVDDDAKSLTSELVHLVAVEMPKTREDVVKAFDKVAELPFMKARLAEAVQKAAGPSQTRPTQQKPEGEGQSSGMINIPKKAEAS